MRGEHRALDPAMIKHVAQSPLRHTRLGQRKMLELITALGGFAFGTDKIVQLLRYIPPARFGFPVGFLSDRLLLTTMRLAVSIRDQRLKHGIWTISHGLSDRLDFDPCVFGKSGAISQRQRYGRVVYTRGPSYVVLGDPLFLHDKVGKLSRSSWGSVHTSIQQG